MFDLLAEIQKEQGGGLAGNRTNTEFPVAESWRKVAENSGGNRDQSEIRQNPPRVAENNYLNNQCLTVKSANPPNPPPTESQKTDSRVIPITPATPNPVSEAAIQIAMERAVIGIPITPMEFRACIDTDEAQWCATNRIPIKSARAYARLFADALARDNLHPSKCGQVTCWACSNYRGKICIKRKTCHSDLWHRCDSYREADPEFGVWAD